MMNRTVLLALVVGFLLMVAVVWYGLSLTSDNDVSKFSGAASGAAAVGGFLAFFVLVIYTAETSKLRKATVELGLFDKRFRVYFALRQFLNTLSQPATQLLLDTNQAQFLFKPDIEEFLLEVYKKAVHVQSHKEQEEHALKQGVVMPLPDNVAAESLWLSTEAHKLAREKFEPYLKKLYLMA